MRITGLISGSVNWLPGTKVRTPDAEVATVQNHQGSNHTILNSENLRLFQDCIIFEF